MGFKSLMIHMFILEAIVLLIITLALCWCIAVAGAWIMERLFK